ncbi:MAG: phytanoyl-CoA dioxygenase family protein [Gammaproteobacteria bacterium]|nr:phytanoyl-CoA dioxygenase family protein [Gammaproteobacteria bacterium]
MNAQVETHETVVRIPPAASHHTLLVAPDGNFLGVDHGRLTTSATGDDRVMWRAEKDGSYRHATTDQRVRASAIPGTDGVHLHTKDGVLDASGEPASSAATFTPSHGPEQLPSESLAFFRARGWVCLTSILAPDTVDALQRLAGTDGHERESDQPHSHVQAALSVDPAVARTAAEPVSLWLIRAYMQTGDIRLGHTPALIVLHRDDGKRNVQGWHSDFPYHWGISAPGVVPTPTGATVLGVQRNVCVSEFTRERGATAFKLGSHTKDHGPPDEWITAATLQGNPAHRAEHGLPYNGPDADVIEAPAGSIILYDARTWHRAGVNRTPHSRAAILQAMTRMYIMPKSDTSAAYKDFLTSPAHAQLTTRERNEMRNLMLHAFNGPGHQAIGPDQELTELARAASISTGSY